MADAKIESSSPPEVNANDNTSKVEKTRRCNGCLVFVPKTSLKQHKKKCSQFKEYLRRKKVADNGSNNDMNDDNDIELRKQTRSNIRQFLKSQVNNIPTELKKGKNKNKQFQCGVCQKLFRNKHGIKKHINDDHIKKNDFNGLEKLGLIHLPELTCSAVYEKCMNSVYMAYERCMNSVCAVYQQLMNST